MGFLLFLLGLIVGTGLGIALVVGYAALLYSGDLDDSDEAGA